MPIKAKASPSAGHFITLAEVPLFPQLSFSELIGSHTLVVQGHEITIEATVASMQEVADLLGALCYGFPNVLNLTFPDSPYARFAWGTIGEAKFQWHFAPSELQASTTVTSADHQATLLKGAWRRVDLSRRHPRLFMALHYFRIACRLLLSGPNRFAFMAEAVLNLSKSLQALGGEKRDDVRRTLRALGIPDDAIETRYLPAMFLRDAFDVAHISLTQYTPPQLAVMHRYVDQAEASFRLLLTKAFDAVESGNWQPAPTSPDPNDPSVASFLTRLEQNMDAAGIERA